MKNLFGYLFMMLAISTLVFTGCKDDNPAGDNTVNASQTLADYLVEIDMDLNHVIKNSDGQKFVMGAPADGNVSGKYVIDLRSSDKYNTSHIASAHNIEFTELLTEADKADKPILVVCYTGQTACYATSLLRLYGYHDAQALKWGMSGWSASTDSWTNNVANIAEGHANWTYSTAKSSEVFDMPSFTSTATSGDAILKERVEYIVSQGFKGIDAQDVLDSPSNYFINNYFNNNDYLGFGHINGAHRLHELLISPSSSEVSSVTNINPDKQIITYCYTGQTSAVITAYLRVLGYDAYSLKFGMNKLYNLEDSWTVNQWGADSNPKDLPLE